MGVTHERMAEKADEIEQELRRLGWWEMPTPEPGAFASEQAFFGDTMAFPQWIKHVLLARIRDAVATEGEFPVSSSVGARAVRELDGQDEANRLVSLLSQMDRIINDAALSLEGEGA